MILPDAVRLPGAGGPASDEYKDWLHLNLFDHARDAVGLVNVSVHGRPGAAGTQVVAAALLDIGGRWVGDVVPSEWAEAAVGLTTLSTRTCSIALVGEVILAAASTRNLAVCLTATPVTAEVEIASRAPFGTGWIGWRVVPRLRTEGWIAVDGTRMPVQIDAYHDHNWGRWHWGDDVGWEWGSFVGAPGYGPGCSVVLARTTALSHRDASPFAVIMDVDGIRRRFEGGRVRVRWSSQAPPPTCRRPGAPAALHADRRRPRLPGALHLTARCGGELLELEFGCRAVAQLILADPVVPGYSFLHEMSGHFQAHARVSGRDSSFRGLGMVEILS
jgi:hypothetical protein